MPKGKPTEPLAASEGSKPTPAKPRAGEPSKPPEPAPVAAPPGPVVDAARNFVRDYYAALDARRFGVAWEMLAPEAQAAFGGFAGWGKGYARTVSHSTRGLTVRAAGAGATVGLTLRAGDRSACGTTVERRFAVTWRPAGTEAGWLATAATARKLGGPEPAAVCSL